MCRTHLMSKVCILLCNVCFYQTSTFNLQLAPTRATHSNLLLIESILDACLLGGEICWPHYSKHLHTVPVFSMWISLGERNIWHRFTTNMLWNLNDLAFWKASKQGSANRPRKITENKLWYLLQIRMLGLEILIYPSPSNMFGHPKGPKLRFSHYYPSPCKCGRLSFSWVKSIVAW